MSYINSFSITQVYSTYGPVAQLGERLHGMEEVRGSNPLRSTKHLHLDMHGLIDEKSGWYHGMTFRPSRMKGFFILSIVYSSCRSRLAYIF